MKKFEQPEIKVISVEVEDVIMASPEVLSYGKDAAHTGVSVGSTTGATIFK